MASLYECLTPNLPVIWTVDNPVGKDSTNSIEDVYLVQFFLKKVVASPHYPQKYKPPQPWDVNGCWQASMHDGIRFFQWFLYARSETEEGKLPPLVNGRVDPVLPGNKSKVQPSLNSTMVYLCNSFRGAAKDTYDNLMTSREVPSALHFALLRAGQAHLKRQRSLNH